MDYVFQFGTVWRDWRLLLAGFGLTMRLVTESMVLGLGIGVFGAWAAAQGASVAAFGDFESISKQSATRRSWSSC